MKYRIEGILFISMIATGLIYGLIFHLTLMPIFGGLALHCISTGILFQAVNYFIVLFFYKKYVALKQTNKLLHKNLEIDKLTGLYNRRALDNRIKTLETYEKFSVIFIDIDNFRDFNNKYGHQTGDIVLKDVSSVIKSIVDNKGSVYRYGGEEIVVLLKDCYKNDAEEIAENIRLAMNELHTNTFLRVTLSLGVASYPEDGDNGDEVVKSADCALLQAKSRGKNCVVARKNKEELA
ncbi:GGDEF domain-containing protein [Clostridium tyrobutyricum]|jgi:diguanylate cyclase|uniref:GGDEF domain-containing protein n=1 Tax=Clostridium tyrobutyricum TaxID=1519 RepID=UPI002B1EE06F|nr:GGDEF domain-containing protein [Clostridium tyrobutyricum]MEA5009911.1 GGDEF domain-containing protein [Clostridium tyrobutyricum]